MMCSWHRTPDTQRFPLRTYTPARTLLFWQNPTRQACSLPWQKMAARSSSWAIPEYDRVTLDGEYKRDLSKGLPIEMPKNYYRDNNPDNGPQLLWRAHANNLYTNWLNYYVYQATPYNLYGTPDFSGK